MARDKANQTNIDGSDPGNYPHKRIRNNDGSGNGTPVNEQVYGDIHEFFGKVMDESKTPFNGLPDNVTNGYQYYESLMSLGGKNDLILDINQLNVNVLSAPLKISALKLGESVTFRAAFDSLATMNLIQGTDAVSKQLSIVGTWKNGQFVRIINYSNFIQITGLYDSQIVPNLAETLSQITTQFQNWSKIMTVFQANGAMVFWNKPANQIPPGWREVEDWKGRMPVGLDTSQAEFAVMGKIGGEKSHTLTLAEMPKHSHIGDTLQIAESPRGTGFVAGDYNNLPGYTSEQGGDLPHNNLPPYRVVLFIEYVG